MDERMEPAVVYWNQPMVLLVESIELTIDRSASHSVLVCVDGCYMDDMMGIWVSLREYLIFAMRDSRGLWDG